MPTLAETLVALAAIAVIDLAVFAVGGVLFLAAAVVASTPLAVALVHR